MLTLFSFRRCPFALRVRMVLHEKELEFETVEEDLKNFSDRLRALHPEAKVPVLVHQGKAFYESAIITEYLEDAFPQKRHLMPQAASERADVRLWTYWCNQIFKPDVDRLKYGTHRFTEQECSGVQERVVAHLTKLETRLKEASWLVGDSFSLADIHVFPFFRQLARVQPSPPFLSEFSCTAQWLEKITQREAFRLSMGL